MRECLLKTTIKAIPQNILIPLTKKKIFFLALLWLLCAERLPAAPLWMENTLGFGSAFRVNTWTPLSVIVENRGKLIEGTLEVVVRSGNEYKNNMEETSYQQPVELPAHSRKKYEFIVLIRTASHPLKIHLWQHGKIIHSQSLPLQPHVSEKKIALLLGESGNWSLLHEIAQEMRPVFVRAGELPRVWYGYEGVSLVMVQSSIFKNFTRRQFEALIQWLENGGFLIVNGGLDYSFFSNRRMKKLATFQVKGLEQTQRLHALEPFAGETFVAQNQFLLLNAKIDGGQILLQEDSLPLVTEKPVGAGKLLFLAFDFQSALFQGWQGNLNFWQWLHSFQPPENPSLSRLSERQILPHLMATLSSQFPPYPLILTLLVLYATLTFVFLNRLRNRVGGKNGLLLILTFLFFSGATAWLYAQGEASDPQINQFTLLTKPARSPLAYAQQWTALYSFQPGSLTIETETHGHPMELLEAKYVKAMAEERLIQTNGVEKRILEIPTRRWAHQYLTAQFSIPFPLSGIFAAQAGGLQLVLENQTPFDIQEGLIYWAERLIPVGALPANTRKIIQLTQAQVQDHPPLQRGRVREPARVLAPTDGTSFLKRFQQAALEDVLRAILKNYAPQKDRILFLGWLQSHGRGLFPQKQKILTDGQDHVALIEWEILAQ